MSRYNSDWQNAELVYQAAERWRDRCLLGNGSVFTDAQLWREEHFRESLQKNYVDKPEKKRTLFLNWRSDSGRFLRK